MPLYQVRTMPRAAVMAPASTRSRGLRLSVATPTSIDYAAKRFRGDPVLAGIFLRQDGSNLQPGDRLVQTDLATTLDAIAKDGPDALYRGRIPAAIEAASKVGGGILTADDFAHYEVIETPPHRTVAIEATSSPWRRRRAAVAHDVRNSEYS